MQKQNRKYGLRRMGLWGLVLLGFSACSAKTVSDPVGGSTSNAGGAGGSTGGGNGGAIVLPQAGALAPMGGSTTDGPLATPWPPPGYVNVTTASVGSYGLGPEISGGVSMDAGLSETEGSLCSGLYGVVRDFKMGDFPGGHPDFQIAFSGHVKGIVQNTLGADRKPVYAGLQTPSTHSKELFDQWYRDTPGVNRTFVLGLRLSKVGDIPTFSAVRPTYFFPLDNQGFGNEGQLHNFSFTTEIHTAFKYKGGETFTFVGDDDVWVFINKKLVIDLGGRHGQLEGSIAVDSLGLEKGKEYELAVFHAERHTSESNFQIQSTLEFVDCGQIIY